MRRSVFVDIGGLDESLGDAQIGIDLSIRMRRFELSILFNGHVVMKGKKPLLPLAIGNEADSRNFLQKHKINLEHLDPYSEPYHDGTRTFTNADYENTDFGLDRFRRKSIAPLAMRI